MPCPARSVLQGLLNPCSRWAPLSWPTGVLRTSGPATVGVDAPLPQAPFPQGHPAVGERTSPAEVGLALHPQPDQQEQVTSHSLGLCSHGTASQKRHGICLFL